MRGKSLDQVTIFVLHTPVHTVQMMIGPLEELRKLKVLGQ